MAVGVVLADQQGQFGAVARCLAALVDRVDQLEPAMFVGDVAWPFGRRRTALAQVMQQAGPAHAQRLLMPGALLQHHQAVHAGVHLGVMGCRLRDAEQGIEFRQQLGQGAAVAQHLDEHIGARLHQRAGNFLPAAFRGERAQFAGLGELAHQRQGFRRHAEAQRCVARGEAGDAQHAQRVLGEGRGDMAQEARFKVALAAVGVGDMALVVLGHGIDGQVAADQVFFQSDVRTGVKGEAAITLAGFALGAGEGVFLAAVGMQKDREVRAHRAKATGLHGFGAGADHHPVDIADGPAEQAVAHGAADFVDLHE